MLLFTEGGIKRRDFPSIEQFRPLIVSSGTGWRRKVSRNSMETCNGGSLLASFPRDFPRGNEEGSRESREGWRKVHARAFLRRLDEGGNRQRERERGIVGRKSKKLWSRVGSFLSRRAREMAPDQGGGTKKGRRERIV